MGQLEKGQRTVQSKRINGVDLTQLPAAKGDLLDDFLWAESDEPHALRRKQIAEKYPQVKELFGVDPWAPYKIAAVVLTQITIAYLLRDASWSTICVAAYFVGAFMNHNLFLAIHELSHNLALPVPRHNQYLGIFANLPIGVPMAVTFKKYHLDHHRYQGVEGLDVDIPSQAEGHYVRNTLAKLMFVLFQLFFYALRPLFTNPKPPGTWEFANLAVQVAFDVALVTLGSWKSLAYLLIGTFVGGGLHPIAGHFIAEHYVFVKGQETYSYYGPLNWLAWHVGYHNEHHDFPRIPGARLHKLRKLAPEFYDGLAYHSSWSMVIWKYITDPTIGPYSRVMRKRTTGSADKDK